VPRVGVLALQGDVREHTPMLEESGADVVMCARADDLEDLDGLVMPGGESTTIAHLLTPRDCDRRSKTRLEDGCRVFGTCAGLILLSREILDGRRTSGASTCSTVAVRATATGARSRASRALVDVKGVGTVPGVFIRSPKIESWSEVEVLATYDHGDGEHPVLVRQRNVWGCSFHPELTSDPESTDSSSTRCSVAVRLASP
jgi:pyridoxal 5'-phosphate synthase pdxT subunit